MEITKLSPDLISKIGNIVRLGISYSDACVSLLIDPSKAMEWAMEGEKAAEGLYRDLFVEVHQAMAQTKVLAYQRIWAEGGAQGAKWVLQQIEKRDTKSLPVPPRKIVSVEDVDGEDDDF